MPRDEATLLDIVTAARLAIEFRDDLDKDAFLADLKTRAAVLHELLVLGEAVKRLSPGFRSKVAEVPWNLIAGMRDILIHHYDAVDADEVWKAVTVDIPRLLHALKPFVPEEPS